MWLLGDEESHIDEKTKELKGKDDMIALKEKIIQEKVDSIGSLQSELSSLQVWNVVDPSYWNGFLRACYVRLLFCC